MKQLKIVYNPFLVTSTFAIDGKAPGENSSLSFHKQRLQEWAEKLPKILLDEYRDQNFKVEFKGTLDDFTDLKEILEANKDGVKFSDFKHERTPDVVDVEDKVIDIYEEIKNGPVESLKDADIQKAFGKAMSSEFAINVVATMSSGKSSLINSLLGANLMPVAQMATTATIVKIIDSDQDNFSGRAFNSEGKEIAESENLDLKTMREWNSNTDISLIEIFGRIPCVDAVGMRLVLIDTPGPNNSRDKNHKKLTYEMLEDSEKSLVLFVMNATQLNIDNEAEFLDFVCKCMKQGGKQSRDRFIFAVNKLDLFKKSNGDNVEDALESVKEGLDARDIKNPNIFPISAIVASQIRTNDDEEDELAAFERKCSKNSEFHFEDYYNFNHLPLPSRAKLDEAKCKEEGISETELHTGIPSVEEAIRLYVNKYARTIKVKDLVDAFNKRLIELEAMAKIQERIQKDKKEKERLDKEISRIQDEINSGKSAKEYAKLIDKIDVSSNVKSELNTLVGGLQKRIDDQIRKFKNEKKLPKATALRHIKALEKEKKDILDQMESKISKVFEKTFKDTYDEVMSIYRQRLQKLGFASSEKSFDFNPLDFIGQEMSKDVIMDKLVKDNTKTDTTYKETTRTRIVRGAKKINWFWEPSTWFTNRYEEKEETYTVKVPEKKDYVDMEQLVNTFFVPTQASLISIEKDVLKHLSSQAKLLKESLKRELSEVEKILNNKLEDVKKRTDTSLRTAAQIKQQEAQLAWMGGIVKRVNELINY